MRIAILGAGALGSVLGGLLARVGKEVSLWDVNDAHIAAIRVGGLRLDGPAGSDVIEIPALRPEEAHETPDLIILLTKTLQTQAALSGIARHIAAGAHVLTLQNGLGTAERVAEMVPPARVLYGCTLMPGRFIAPGHVASQGKGYAVYRALAAEGEAFAARAEVTVEGLSLEHSPETDQVIWQKAAFNCAMNACSALTGARVGQLEMGAGMRDLLHAVSDEVVDLALSKGVTVDRSEVRDQIAHALVHHTDHKPSMLQDIEAGRQTEIASLCGEVARQAEITGLPAPLNTALASLVSLKSVLAQDPT